ncbi:MAG TPA: TetR/AcrR family transcriptional regulator [Solirubrobacteraceae bacterium]
MREFQRMRIVSAMVAVVCERGVALATVGDVVAKAGVSRKTFYEIFDDREDCLLAAIDQTVERVSERVKAACVARRRSWIDCTRAGLLSLLHFCDQEPALARLCVVDSVAAGPEVLDRRKELLKQLARVVDEGRTAARREPPPLAAEGVVGGVLGVIHGRLVVLDGTSFIEMLGPLMSFIVLPYRGAGIAHRELHRPLPIDVGETNGFTSATSRVGGLDMRLTYRTTRVLGAIAAEPGLSNVRVGERAGVTDQGQISKLLSRLAGLQLIENTGQGQRNGAANAWQLTDRGEAIVRLVRQQRAPQFDGLVRGRRK